MIFEILLKAACGQTYRGRVFRGLGSTRDAGSPRWPCWLSSGKSTDGDVFDDLKGSPAVNDIDDGGYLVAEGILHEGLPSSVHQVLGVEQLGRIADVSIETNTSAAHRLSGII